MVKELKVVLFLMSVYMCVCVCSMNIKCLCFCVFVSIDKIVCLYLCDYNEKQKE